MANYSAKQDADHIWAVGVRVVWKLFKVFLAFVLFVALLYAAVVFFFISAIEHHEQQQKIINSGGVITPSNDLAKFCKDHPINAQCEGTEIQKKWCDGTIWDAGCKNIPGNYMQKYCHLHPGDNECYAYR